MGVDRGVVLGVPPGDVIKLKVVGLITPLNAFTGLKLGYVNTWKEFLVKFTGLNCET